MDVEWRRVAAYVAVHDGAGRLLLTRFAAPGHPDDGKWSMPGGGMEWGESPEQTACRELVEETGLAVSLGPVMGVFSRWFTDTESARGEAGHLIGIVYGTAGYEGTLRTEFDPGTTDAARWFTAEEIRALPHVEQVDFVLELIA